MPRGRIRPCRTGLRPHLNHKRPRSTRIYARQAIDSVRQSVNSATASMLEAAGLHIDLVEPK
jgi:hypothetical protein